MITEQAGETWDRDLDHLLTTIGHHFGRVEPRRRMRDYVRALLGPVARKNSWQLAEHAGHAAPDALQHLLSRARWNPDGIRDDQQVYVAEHLGRPDGVLIIDDTGFLKKGTTSAGVQRQYSGTAGRTENCQIGVFAAYASTAGRALVGRELYLPKSWTDDRDRCRAAKVPDQREFATKNTLAAIIVRRALVSPRTPPAVRTTAFAGCWNFGCRLCSGRLQVSVLPGRTTHRQALRTGPRPGMGTPLLRRGGRRDNASTTGRRPSCVRWTNTTTRTAC